LRALPFVLVIGIVMAALVAVGTAQSDEQLTTYQGKTARGWHTRYVKEHKALTRTGALARRHMARARSLRRALAHRPSSLEAIRLASIAYGAPYGEMVSIASCESPGLVTHLRNSSTASGLFQFLDSTWARSAYGRENVYSPYANALAAAWLWRADGRSWHEWVCRP